MLQRQKPLYTISSDSPMVVFIAMYVCMVITYSKSMDEPGEVANPTRGQLYSENEYFLVPFCHRVNGIISG